MPADERYTLPPDLPVPQDDGAADHLPGAQLPSLVLPATVGDGVDVAELGRGVLVLFVYPRTGKPGEPVPEDWDAIPGARGCTVQACAYRDRHHELADRGAQVAGLSAQTPDEQAEFAAHEGIDYPLLSDPELRLAQALNLPTFQWRGKTLYKRLTLLVRAGRIERVVYPVFPPGADANEAVGWAQAGEGAVSAAELPLTLLDFERAAAERLEEGPHAYYAGGACDEITLGDNEAAWRRIAIRSRVLVDVSRVDPTTTVLGRPRAHPIMTAPTAFHRLAHPEGERATARAAAAEEAVFCLSSLATMSPAEVAEAVPGGTRWFQLYVFKDRGVSDELVRAAADSGYEALVVTVDLPVLGVRDREIRSGYVIPETTAIPSAKAVGHQGGLPLTGIGELIDPSLTWKDIEAFASASRLPVLVKGVLTAEDARLAVEHGAAGVIVSNHGGRQLDTVLSGADALPAVAEAVGGRIEVLVDGGIRRGSDVLKALALGAAAVLVGRPVLWGLAVGGEEGVRRVLSILRAEFEAALALAGIPRAADLEGSMLTPAPWAGHVPFQQ